MSAEIKTDERMLPYTATARVHYCGTTNVRPPTYTLCVLPINQEPTADFIAIHDREVRERAATEIAAGLAFIIP